ncbi:MAG TPA: type II toxin-antitoxin system HicA family toxin [Oscillatoriaceae cyanobacterium]
MLATLIRIGWKVARQTGSHKTLTRLFWPPYRFAFHYNEELGPAILAKIAKDTGLRPEDLLRRHSTRGDTPLWRCQQMPHCFMDIKRAQC